MYVHKIQASVWKSDLYEACKLKIYKFFMCDSLFLSLSLFLLFRDREKNWEEKNEIWKKGQRGKIYKIYN